MFSFHFCSLASNYLSYNKKIESRQMILVHTYCSFREQSLL